MSCISLDFICNDIVKSTKPIYMCDCCPKIGYLILRICLEVWLLQYSRCMYESRQVTQLRCRRDVYAISHLCCRKPIWRLIKVALLSECDVAATSQFAPFATYVRYRNGVAGKSQRHRCDPIATQTESPRMLACHAEVIYKPHLPSYHTVVQWSSAYSISSEMRARQLLVCLV